MSKNNQRSEKIQKQGKTVKGDQIIIILSVKKFKQFWLLLKGFRQYYEPYLVSCLIGTESPTMCKKLTTWWSDSHQDIICHRSKHWPQEIETDWLLNWRLSVFKTIKMTDQNTHNQLQEIIRADYTVSTGRHSLSLWKLMLTHCELWGEGESALDRHLPTPWLPASKIKQTSFSTNLASLIFFEWWTARPHIRLQCQPVRRRVGEHLWVCFFFSF